MRQLVIYDGATQSWSAGFSGATTLCWWSLSSRAEGWSRSLQGGGEGRWVLEGVCGFTAQWLQQLQEQTWPLGICEEPDSQPTETHVFVLPVCLAALQALSWPTVEPRNSPLCLVAMSRTGLHVAVS